MPTDEIIPRCPNCDSDEISQTVTVAGYREVHRWEIINGRLAATRFSSVHIDEVMDVEGYHCADCGRSHSIGDLLTGDERATSGRTDMNFEHRDRVKVIDPTHWLYDVRGVVNMIDGNMVHVTFRTEEAALAYCSFTQMPISQARSALGVNPTRPFPRTQLEHA